MRHELGKLSEQMQESYEKVLNDSRASMERLVKAEVAVFKDVYMLYKMVRD